jgi:hypothetical protein
VLNAAEFWDDLCEKHGGLSHAVLHEAGHAVVATIFNYPFEDVSVHEDPREHEMDTERRIGGGVRFTSLDELYAIMRADPRNSLLFSLAGEFAEKLAFGHHLDRSSAVDLNIWCHGVGLSTGLPQEDIETTLNDIIGEPYANVLRATNILLAANDVAVLAVARALADERPMLLTRDSVNAIVAANAAMEIPE